MGIVHTWVVVLKFSQIVDIVIDDDVEVIALVMRRDVGFGERLRHGVSGSKETGYLTMYPTDAIIQKTQMRFQRQMKFSRTRKEEEEKGQRKQSRYYYKLASDVTVRDQLTTN